MLTGHPRAGEAMSAPVDREEGHPVLAGLAAVALVAIGQRALAGRRDYGELCEGIIVGMIISEGVDWIRTGTRPAPQRRRPS